MKKLKYFLFEEYEKEIQVFLRDMQELTKKKLTKVVKKSLSDNYLPGLIKRIYQYYNSNDYRVVKLVFDLMLRDSSLEISQSLKNFQVEIDKLEKEYQKKEFSKSELQEYIQDSVEELIIQIENRLDAAYERNIKLFKNTIIRHFEQILNYSKVSDSERVSRKQKTLGGFVNHLKSEDIFKDSVRTEIEESVYLFFPEGVYWVKTSQYSQINKTKCILTGHCGQSSVGTEYLFHLFDKDLNLLMTVDYDIEKSEIFQIRGKNNLLPPKKSWKYLVELINKDNIKFLNDNLEYVNNFDLKKQYYELFRFLEENTNIQNKLKYYDNEIDYLLESVKFKNISINVKNNEVEIQYKLDVSQYLVDTNFEKSAFEKLYQFYYMLKLDKISTHFSPGKILNVKVFVRFKDLEEFQSIMNSFRMLDSDLQNPGNVLSSLERYGYLKT